jgi:CRP-like cAMP-binding protein
MNVLNILSDKALAMNRHLKHLSARNIRGKISSYLMEEYRDKGNTIFNIPMKRNELADYLNIPRPSLSREMSMMKKDGLLDYRGAWIEIKDIIALENYSE